MSCKIQYIYLTTTGRHTGNPHTVKTWFVLIDDRYYVMSSKKEDADWVKNLRQDPHVSIKLGVESTPALARVFDGSEPAALVDSVKDKMQGKYNWDTGLIVELTPQPA